eukprot:5999314-Prymnesium_polylepis.1
MCASASLVEPPESSPFAVPSGLGGVASSGSAVGLGLRLRVTSYDPPPLGAKVAPGRDAPRPRTTAGQNRHALHCA